MSVRLLTVFLIVSLGGTVLRCEVVVNADFENGSARVQEIDHEGQRVRISPGGDPKRGWPNWWYFRVEGLDSTKPLIVEVVARDAEVPNDSGELRRLSPSWTLPSSAALSVDGKTWVHSPPGDRDGAIGRYHLETGATVLWVAWGPPFTHSDSLAWIEESTQHPAAKPFDLARSREGRVVRGLSVAEGEKPSSERPAIWITGRQHAWECGGSWVALGFVRWLLSAAPEAVWLRRNAEVFVVPVLDVDHVATGDGGKGAVPQDHNRDWSDAPHWPEVAAVQSHIRRLSLDNRMAVFLDSHNPGAGARIQTFYVQYPPYSGPEAAAAQERFLAAAREQFGEIRLLDGKPSVPEHLPIWKAIAASWVCENANANTVSLTVETPWNTADGTVQGYHAVGAKLGRATVTYLRDREDNR